MLENIKSQFIRKLIFNNLNELIKLNLIKYNKRLQKSLYLDLINYKTFSGKYIKYETENKGKIYNAFNDKLIYEGNLLNGKKNGKGKEYDENGKLIFEGEYLNGKRNIKGNTKEYQFYEGLISLFDINKFLIYEGEYSKGKKKGKGKEYYKCKNKKIKFEGLFLNGKKWDGIGFDMHDNIQYELNDGKGYIKEYNENNTLIFEGEYVNGEKNGKGKEYNNDGKLIYEGNYLNSKKNGKGKEYNDKGELIFEGDYLYDHRRKGKEFLFEKLEYEGEYLFDKKWSGKGFNERGKIIYILFDGTGCSKEYYHNGNLKLECGYLYGKKNGKCEEYNENGILIFDGEYLNGEKSGNCKEFNDYGKIIFEGEYLNGKRNGKGKEYDDNGNLIFDGEYINGEKKFNEKNII